jgi:hypothetical protein
MGSQQERVTANSGGFTSLTASNAKSVERFLVTAATEAGARSTRPAIDAREQVDDTGLLDERHGLRAVHCTHRWRLKEQRPERKPLRFDQVPGAEREVPDRAEEAEYDSGAMWLQRVLARRRARKGACAAAEAGARTLRPKDPILSSVILAEENGRYVVRVFVGLRDETDPVLGPGWRECLVFAVPNEGGEVTLVDDERYRARLR